MDNKKTEGNPLLAEIKKSRKTKRKNKKCEEYAIKKFRENRDGKDMKEFIKELVQEDQKKNQNADIFDLNFE